MLVKGCGWVCIQSRCTFFRECGWVFTLVKGYLWVSGHVGKGGVWVGEWVGTYVGRVVLEILSLREPGQWFMIPGFLDCASGRFFCHPVGGFFLLPTMGQFFAFLPQDLRSFDSAVSQAPWSFDFLTKMRLCGAGDTANYWLRSATCNHVQNSYISPEKVKKIS